jgi:hypothetical protein
LEEVSTDVARLPIELVVDICPIPGKKAVALFNGKMVWPCQKDALTISFD